MTLPITIKNVIETAIIENFGSFQNLEDTVTSQDLQYILNYPTDIYILKLWDIFFDLEEIGKNQTQPYFILDKQLRLIHKVPYGNNLGLNTENLEYIFSLKNGDYFHIAYWDNFRYKTFLIWLIKDRTLKSKQEKVKVWQEERNSLTPTIFKKGELLIKNNLQSRIKIYYMAGELNLIPMPLNIIRMSNNQPIIDTEDEYIVFRPQLNGWYTIISLGDDIVYPLKLINLRGIGLNKIAQLNGSIHFSIISKLDSQSDSYDTTNLKRLVATAELSPYPENIERDIVTVTNNKISLINYTLN